MSDPAQTACYVNAGMAGVKAPEKTRLRLGGDVVDMESSLALDDARRGPSDAREARLARLHATGTGSATGSGGDARTVEVDVLPAAEVARRCDIPKRFAALSVDAEGWGIGCSGSGWRVGFGPNGFCTRTCTTPNRSGPPGGGSRRSGGGTGEDRMNRVFEWIDR